MTLQAKHGNNHSQDHCALKFFAYICECECEYYTFTLYIYGELPASRVKSEELQAVKLK